MYTKEDFLLGRLPRNPMFDLEFTEKLTQYKKDVVVFNTLLDEAKLNEHSFRIQNNISVSGIIVQGIDY